MSARDSAIGRREFLALGGGAFGLAVVAVRSRTAPEPGRLTSRFHRPPKEQTLAPGEHVLHVDGDRKSILWIPANYDPKRATPFCLALHGATGSGETMLRGTRAAAEKHGVIVLSPSSRDFTWDAIRADYADDLARMDKLLGEVFDRCSIDPRHVGIAGFSDGATYALSIGLVNGDVFTHVIAHSPGFIIGGSPHGKPRIFISHGLQDTILPIDQCGRRIARELEAGGYRVRYDEFEGGHAATPAMRETAFAWFAG